MQALVGPGWSGDPAADPAAALAATRDMLADVAHSATQAWQRTSAEWAGAGSDAAAQFAATTAAAIDEAAERASGLGVTAGRAAESVAAAHQRLQAIVDDFEARAGALVFTGGDDEVTVRVVVRPSGTEPKLKCYIEIRCAGQLEQARARAAEVQDSVAVTFGDRRVSPASSRRGDEPGARTR
ncbi:hypothetical protein [Mycolicibacterium hippocampi]|uniref:hypothetical protein n=1 Tax=Mycolicibacterium hippocampi TaxID=659824 RepID=UPI003F497499